MRYMILVYYQRAKVSLYNYSAIANPVLVTVSFFQLDGNQQDVREGNSGPFENLELKKSTLWILRGQNQAALPSLCRYLFQIKNVTGYQLTPYNMFNFSLKFHNDEGKLINISKLIQRS